MRACVCGSDLHSYRGMSPGSGPAPMGHEFICVVEETGSDVSSTLKKGDFVVSPFVVSDNSCVFCREGFHTSCVHGGFYGAGGVGGGQAEAIRVPQAAGTLVTAPASADSDPALLNSLLAITDVYLTDYHAAYMGRIEPGRVFDRVVDLDHVAEGYRAMDDRAALKVAVTP